MIDLELASEETTWEKGETGAKVHIIEAGEILNGSRMAAHRQGHGV